jgi:hypothetical protein
MQQEMKMQIGIKNINYPNKTYVDKSGFAETWIEVGASDSKDDETLKADFPNYGKLNVDVIDCNTG